MLDFLRFAALLLLLTVGWVALIFYSLRALGWGLERRPFVTVAVTVVVVLLLIGSANWLYRAAAW